MIVLTDVNNENIFANVKGLWISSNNKNEYIIGYENGEYIYLKNESPIHLIFNGDGSYTLEFDDYSEHGTYSISKKRIIMIKSDGLITETCELKKENELHCNKYSSIYIKQ